MTKRELFNAKNNGKAIEKDLVIDVVSVGQFNDVDKDGHDVVVTALADKNGDIFTTISATVGNSIELLSEILDEEGSVTVRVNQSKSNGGRDFYQLEII